jgi:hypothetical protein
MLPHLGWSTTANGSSTASRARKPLGVAAVSAANQWRSPSGREPLATARLQAWGRAEPRAPGASLIRFLSLRLKPKAAAAPNSGNGAGTGIIVATAYISL